MSADTLAGGAVLGDTDEYRHKLAGFLTAQGLVGEVTYEQVASARSRADLGLTSLHVILVMANYTSEHAPDVAFRPEWVARLEDVEGIVAVMREIDSLALAPAGAS